MPVPGPDICRIGAAAAEAAGRIERVMSARGRRPLLGKAGSASRKGLSHLLLKRTNTELKKKSRR